MKKKAIKIATASVIAASSFAAVAPFSTEAAVNVSGTVTKATTQMKKAQDTYTIAAAKGQVVSAATVQTQVNLAKTYYDDAKKVIASNGGSKKAAYTKQLDSALTYYNNAKNYIVGVNYAAGLNAKAVNLQAAVNKKDVKYINANFSSFSTEIAKAEGKVKGYVVGAAGENVVIAKYITPAKKVVTTVNAYLNSVASVSAIKDIAAVAGDATVVLPKTVEVTLVNGKKAQKAVVWDTKGLDLNKPATYTLSGTVAGTALKASVKVVVAAVQVTSVTAINGKTIEVKFNTAIDAKTLKNVEVDVITVVAGEGATDAGAVTQKLSEDGKTLTLTATNIFKGDYTVKVPFEIVKGTNGQFLAPVNAKVTVADTAAPVLSSVKSTVKSTSDKVSSVTLTFDETVKSIEVVKLGGVNYQPIIDGNTATISNLALDATKSYDVTVVNAKDYAGNTKDVQSATLSVSVDNVAPSITSVEVTGENTVKVTLDKALKNNNLAITGKIGTFVVDAIESIKVNPENSKEYTLTLKKEYLFKSGNSDVVTLTVAKDKLVDTIGNINSSDIIKTVTVSKDVVAPAVTKVETTVTNNKVTAFTVNYTEEVTLADASKVYVVNSKGEILSLASVATPKVDDKDNKKVVFTIVGGLKADTYSFDLLEGYVTDKSLAANKSAKYSFSVNVADAATPVETSFTISKATEVNNVVTVEFGQKVKATGTGSALNPLAYSVNGVSLPADTKIEFVTTNGVLDQSKVTITLPAGFVKANDTAAVFRVTGVQTLDNKVSNPFIQTIDIQDNTAPVALSVVATDLKTLAVTYSEAVKLVTLAEGQSNDVSDEIKLFDSKGAAITIDKVAVDKDGKLVLTVADATAVTKLTTVKTDKADILDLYDIAQSAGITLSK